MCICAWSCKVMHHGALQVYFVSNRHSIWLFCCVYIYVNLFVVCALLIYKIKYVKLGLGGGS